LTIDTTVTLAEWRAAIQRAASRLPDPVTLGVKRSDFDEWCTALAASGQMRPNGEKLPDSFDGLPIWHGAAYTHVVDRSGRTSAVIRPRRAEWPPVDMLPDGVHIPPLVQAAEEQRTVCAKGPALLRALADVCEKFGGSIRPGKQTGSITVCLGGHEVWSGYAYPHPAGPWRTAAARMENAR
jgi:hypothetical protein